MGNCSECGKEVAGDEQVCPECGPAKDEPKKKGNTLIIVLTLFLLISAVSFSILAIRIASRRVQATSFIGDDLQSCQLGGDVRCLDATIREDSVQLILKNRKWSEVVIQRIEITGCAPLNTELRLAPRAEETVEIEECEMGGLAQAVRVGFTVDYTKGSGSRVRSDGIVAGFVESRLRSGE